MELTPRRVCNLLLSLLLASCVLPWAARAANNPVPLINTPLVPTSVAPGGAGFTLTVNGTGFVSGAVINWNGTALTTTFVSSSQLTATVPAANTAGAGTAAITVVNPTGGGTSNVVYFEITSPASSLSFTSFPTSSTSQGLLLNLSQPVTGDFNGDGKLDIAIPLNIGIAILLGNGDGTFGSPNIIGAATASGSAALAVGDFNGDSKLDLAYGNSSGALTILLGNGDGTFQSSTNAQPLGIGTIATGDFNRDGKLDLAVVGQGSTSIEILLGNGDGTFQTPLTIDAAPGAPSYEGLSGIAMGDFNGDGNLDLAVGVAVFGAPLGHPPPAVALGVSILLGKGDGTFQLTTSGITSNEVMAVATADFNHDGKLDLLAGQGILLGNGDGTFQSLMFIPAAGLWPFLTGDFDADGNLDVAWSYDNPVNVFSGVIVSLGNGNGTLQPFVEPFGVGQEYGGAPIGGDFNGDGKLDLLTVGNTSGNGAPGVTVTTLLQGVFPYLSPSPTSLTFSNQTVGTTSPAQTITVTNGGQVATSVPASGIEIVGAGAGGFSQTNNCTSALAPEGTCQINVTFAPLMDGTYLASVSIHDSTAAGPELTVPLTGFTPAPPPAPAVSLSPSTVTFPAQYVGGSGLPQTVTVTNTGNATLTITAATASPADFGVLSNCSNPVAAGSNCTIGVFFDPTTSGTRTGTLTITDNSGGSPQTVALTGSGRDFSMTPGSNASATVTAGQTANYSIAVAPAGGFAANVALSCTGGPTQSTCTVSPSMIALSGTTAKTATVSVTTMAGAQAPLLPFATGRPTTYRQTPRIFAWIGVFLVIAVALSRWRQEQRFRWAPAFALALLVCLGMTLASCGGGSSSGGGGGGGGGTQAGTYAITVTGNFTSGSTNLTHATKLTLVVQ
jgi:hypothetical protein